MMKAVVFTLGCKVNECESDSLIRALTERGYSVSDKLEYADLYIVNTCAVTKEAEKKSRQMSARITAINKNAKIIFTGCACQKDFQSFCDKKNTFLVTGAFSKEKILDLIDSGGVEIFPEPKEFENLTPVRSLRTRTYIKVQDGCNNFCSYCIVPYLRGRSRSRDPQLVRKELIEQSPLEAVINGINLSAYSYGQMRLGDLLNSVKDVKTRIRLGSLEVNVIDEKFLMQLQGLYNFAPHFHLSLQSGADKVLKDMNRHYTGKEYIEKVDLIRKYFPLAGITTDIIVGFPTETERDFEDTLALVRRVGFSDIHPFIYSPRSGTVAYKLADLSKEIKKARQDKLLKLKKECKQKFAEIMVGKTLRFLPETVKDGYVTGYTENYLRVYVKGETIQKALVSVKILKPYLDGAKAEMI